MITCRPILFSAPMVRAILDGRKTQTRRICKDKRGPSLADDCPYGEAPNHMWVREAWAPCVVNEQLTLYRAGCDSINLQIHAFNGTIWKPSIHMPKWRSRITVQITDVRVQRLQEISEEDAIAEGVRAFIEDGCGVYEDYIHGRGTWCMSARGSFASLWESINGHGSWEKNPYVWTISFKRIDAGRRP